MDGKWKGRGRVNSRRGQDGEQARKLHSVLDELQEKYGKMVVKKGGKP